LLNDYEYPSEAFKNYFRKYVHNVNAYLKIFDANEKEQLFSIRPQILKGTYQYFENLLQSTKNKEITNYTGSLLVYETFKTAMQLENSDEKHHSSIDKLVSDIENEFNILSEDIIILKKKNETTFLKNEKDKFQKNLIIILELLPKFLQTHASLIEEVSFYKNANIFNSKEIDSLNSYLEFCWLMYNTFELMKNNQLKQSWVNFDKAIKINLISNPIKEKCINDQKLVATMYFDRLIEDSTKATESKNYINGLEILYKAYTNSDIEFTKNQQNIISNNYETIRSSYLQNLYSKISDYTKNHQYQDAIQELAVGGGKYFSDEQRQKHRSLVDQVRQEETKYIFQKRQEETRNIFETAIKNSNDKFKNNYFVEAYYHTFIDRELDDRQSKIILNLRNDILNRWKKLVSKNKIKLKNLNEVELLYSPSTSTEFQSRPLINDIDGYFKWSGNLVDHSSGLYLVQNKNVQLLQGLFRDAMKDVPMDLFKMTDFYDLGIFAFKDIKDNFSKLQIGNRITVIGRYTENTYIETVEGKKIIPILSGCYVE